MVLLLAISTAVATFVEIHTITMLNGLEANRPEFLTHVAPDQH